MAHTFEDNMNSSEYHCASNPLSTTSSSSSIISSIDSPNHKLEMVLKNLFLFNLPSLHRCNQQSNFLRSYYRLLSVSVEEMLESLIHEGYQYSLPQLSVGILFSTQDLSTA